MPLLPTLLLLAAPTHAWSTAPALLGVLPPPGLQEQETEALPNAGALVRRALRVTGEGEAIEQARARTLRGTVSVAGQEGTGTVRLVQARPNHFLLEAEIPGTGAVRIGYDGETFWVVPATGDARVIDGVAAAQQLAVNAFDFPLRSPKHVRTLETVGRSTFDGRDCWEVRCELKPFVVDGELLDLAATERYRVITDYFEVDSGLLAGTRLVDRLLNDSVTTTFRDYLELAPGVRSASEIVEQTPLLQTTWRLEHLDFEPAPETEFAPPTELVGEQAPDGDEGPAPEDDGGGDGDCR